MEKKTLKLVVLLCFGTLFLVACNGGGSSSGSTPIPTPTATPTPTPTVTPTPLASNVVQISAGSGYNGNGINTPYVTVTVCQPNTTICQTVDHILLDTGSVGLKIDQSQLQVSLPAITQTGSGLPISVCNSYGSGYAFSTANYADVYISGEKAANIPVQVIDDSSSQSSVPSSCSNQGNFNNFSDSGARGIIGINPMINLSNTTNYDYTCVNGSCTQINSGIPVPYLNVNPVGYFVSGNSSGEVISLPAVSANTDSNIYGTLTFGINTETNNQVPTNISSVQGDPTDFIGRFLGSSSGSQFPTMFDSGTNHLLFYSTEISQCGDVYCPSSPTAWISQIMNYDLSGSAIALSSIISAPTGYYGLIPDLGIVAASGDGLYGLPFYFGKNVYLGFVGSNSVMGSGPTWGFVNQ